VKKTSSEIKGSETVQKEISIHPALTLMQLLNAQTIKERRKVNTAFNKYVTRNEPQN